MQCTEMLFYIRRQISNAALEYLRVIIYNVEFIVQFDV